MFRIVSAQQPLIVVMPQTRLKSLARGWEEGGREGGSGIELFVTPRSLLPVGALGLGG